MQVMLYIGSALLAFGPFVALFGMVVYPKAQLVIVVTTAAFFLLLSTLTASLFYGLFDLIGLGGPLTAILPGVIAQFLGRVGFCQLYNRVEAVIEDSLKREDESNWTETAKLRLSLNDASCGLAAGIGFGGMHAILLYGSLLAAQISNGVGVLYQESCPNVPSVVVSAVLTALFFILDIFWMLFTFFGVRRRLDFQRGQASVARDDGRLGAYFGNSRHGGNMALLTVLGTHLMTSLLTTANWFKHGCLVSVPATGAMVLITCYIYWMGCGRIYMPDSQVALRSDNPHVD